MMQSTSLNRQTFLSALAFFKLCDAARSHILSMVPPFYIIAFFPGKFPPLPYGRTLRRNEVVFSHISAFVAIVASTPQMRGCPLSQLEEMRQVNQPLHQHRFCILRPAMPKEFCTQPYTIQISRMYAIWIHNSLCKSTMRSQAQDPVQ